MGHGCHDCHTPNGCICPGYGPSNTEVEFASRVEEMTRAHPEVVKAYQILHNLKAQIEIAGTEYHRVLSNIRRACTIQLKKVDNETEILALERRIRVLRENNP